MENKALIITLNCILKERHFAPHLGDPVIFFFPGKFHKFYLNMNLFSVSIIGIDCLFTDISLNKFNRVLISDFYIN